MIQDTIFEISESDNWFLRNKEKLIQRTEQDDAVCFCLKKIADKNIETVIELGSSNGYRLNLLKNIFPSIKKAVGVDASNLAVNDGKTRYGLDMHKSNIVDFSYNAAFDLVIVNFVFHWIDRANILKAIANTDGFVKNGGYLVIGDFKPDFPQKRRYHHLKDTQVYTYKLDYSSIFKNINTYNEIMQITFDADRGFSDTLKATESSSRAFCSILKKDLYNYYCNEV